MHNRNVLIVIVISILLTLPLSAQLERDGLIFSEVYLNEKEPDNSWIEIYNPTKNTLIPEKFRTYGVLTTNILPKEILERGGLEIDPDESIIICPDKSKLKYDGYIRIIQIPEMKYFGTGGFFSMRTKGMGENGIDIIRYGDPSKTSARKDKIGDFVIPFSNDKKSYSLINETRKKGTYGFTKTEPTPGISRKNGAHNE